MLSEREKEYIRFCWKAFAGAIRWADLKFWCSAVVISYLLLGWIGVIIVLIMDYFSLEVAAPFIFFDEMPEEIYERTCSAGIEDCKICGNEYDHEFNVEYQKSLKWYQRII